MSNFAIKTIEHLKEKLDMLESLRDIGVAARIREEIRENEERNILDDYYNRLLCRIDPVPVDVNSY
jgi:hypothetical protein